MPGLRRRLHRRRAGAAPQDPRHDPPRHDRHRRPHAPEHRGVVADGAGQRALRVQRRHRARRAGARRSRPSGGIERAQTIAVLREAIDALVVMISPFAPHTAEELWHMLGHADGLTKAQWPTFDPEVAKAHEVVVPVQVNGKVRGRGSRSPAGLSEDRAARAGARRSGRARHTRTARRSARSWSPRGRSSAWWCRSGGWGCGTWQLAGEGASGSRPDVPLSSSVSSAARQRRLRVLRWRAADRSCRPTSRRSASRRSRNRTTVFNLETQLTQKVRAEFIGRGKYQIRPREHRRRCAADR